MAHPFTIYSCLTYEISFLYRVCKDCLVAPTALPVVQKKRWTSRGEHSTFASSGSPRGNNTTLLHQKLSSFASSEDGESAARGETEINVNWRSRTLLSRPCSAA